jgi:uncharacterized DUF497 family protein
MKKRPELPSPLAFEWDEGNRDKNKLKHDVNTNECEEVFFDNPLITYDAEHSVKEDRYHRHYREVLYHIEYIYTF